MTPEETAGVERIIRINEMSARRIEKAWQGFERAVVPPNASTEQRDAMKMAFYGGGFATFTAIMAMLDPGAEPTDADLANMTEIHNEFQTFNHEACQRAARKGTN